MEAGMSKIKVPADSASAERLLPGSHTAVFSVKPHTLKGAREPSGVSFIRTLILVTMVLPSWLNHLPKTTPTNVNTLAVRFQRMTLGENIYIQSIASPQATPPLLSSILSCSRTRLKDDSIYLPFQTYAPFFSFLCACADYINGRLCHLAPDGNNGREWRKGSKLKVFHPWMNHFLQWFLRGSLYPSSESHSSGQGHSSSQGCSLSMTHSRFCYYWFKVIPALWCYYPRDIMLSAWFPYTPFNLPLIIYFENTFRFLPASEGLKYLPCLRPVLTMLA